MDFLRKALPIDYLVTETDDRITVEHPPSKLVATFPSSFITDDESAKLVADALIAHVAQGLGRVLVRWENGKVLVA